MITHLSGTLVAIEDGAAHVRAGELTYEVLVPAADSMALAARLGQPVSFHTLHYLEGQGQGASFWPRLIGFQAPADRAFFELFTTVKGIGNRKALRAAASLRAGGGGDRRARPRAAPVAAGDRQAHGGDDLRGTQGQGRPVRARDRRARGGTPGKSAAARGPITAESKLMAAARDAVEVLVQLGHSKPAAREMVERVIARDDAPKDATAESIVELALR